MADRKATNRYYPPEFWDQKNFNERSNLNSFRGESWRNRGAQVNSKLLTQGRDVIRFETPFDIWCEKCQEVIHKGVRFNADKKKAGKYFTTTIWEFQLKCHLCDNIMIVATDPQNTTYKCISGCRKKEESWDQDEDTVKLLDEKEKRKLEEDPFYRLEHFAASDGSGKREDEVKSKEKKAVLHELKHIQDVRSRDDGILNRTLRNVFRKQKKEDQATAAREEQEKKRLNMHIPLLPETEEDRILAKTEMLNARVQTEELRFNESKKMARQMIMSSSIMSSKPKSVLQQARMLALQRSKTSGGIAKPRISKLVKQSITPIVKIKKEPQT